MIISHATAADSSNEIVHQQIIEQLQFVKNEYGIEVLAIRDNPRYSFNVLEALEMEGEERTIKKMNEEDNQKDEEFWNKFVEENNSLHKIDLTEYYKENGQFKPVIGNIRVYRDEKHMTNTFSESFGPIFKELIDEILAER